MPPERSGGGWAGSERHYLPKQERFSGARPGVLSGLAPTPSRSLGGGSRGERRWAPTRREAPHPSAPSRSPALPALHSACPVMPSLGAPHMGPEPPAPRGHTIAPRRLRAGAALGGCPAGTKFPSSWAQALRWRVPVNETRLTRGGRGYLLTSQ